MYRSGNEIPTDLPIRGNTSVLAIVPHIEQLRVKRNEDPRSTVVQNGTNRALGKLDTNSYGNIWKKERGASWSLEKRTLLLGPGCGMSRKRKWMFTTAFLACFNPNTCKSTGLFIPGTWVPS